MNVENLQNICGLCQSESPNLRLCGACKLIRYCSSDHQKQHWKSHKPFCHQYKSAIRNDKNKQILKDNPCNSQNDDFTLNKSLLDSILRNQVYSHSNSYQEADLSTPYESVMGIEDKSLSESSSQKPQSLYHLELTPDNYWLADCLGPTWLSDVTNLVLRDLNTYGFCAVDHFLGDTYAFRVLSEVKGLHSRGILSDGQVVSRLVQAQATGMIRGDKITWVTGIERGCETIRQLMSTVDSIIVNANKHYNAGQLANYNITLRTRAMVACYPGGGSRYVKHIDNPNRDGRCITAIYYINENWQPKDGGILRIYPHDKEHQVAQIEPVFDRMLFFWSDRRNPHEVLPSSTIRYAITLWYLDQREREEYLSRCSTSNM